MDEPTYSIPQAPTALRDQAVAALWLFASLGLFSLAFSWINVIDSVTPVGPAGVPVITQQAYYGWTLPHGWMLALLMLWVGGFASFVRSAGVAWLDSVRGGFVRTLLSLCLLAMSALIVYAFVLNTAQCARCPKAPIGMGVYLALATLAGILVSLLLLRHTPPRKETSAKV